MQHDYTSACASGNGEKYVDLHGCVGPVIKKKTPIMKFMYSRSGQTF